ncbi:MAG: carboxypeptidase M32 [bacterium]
MTIFSTDFDFLLMSLREQFQLSSAIAVLHWDQEVFMPELALQSRSDQLAVLTAQLHRLQSSSHFERQLSEFLSLEDGQLLRDDFSVSEKRLLFLTYKQWRKASVLPESFVADFAALKSQAQFYWQKARSSDDPSDFLPYLSRIIESSRLYAGYMDPHADAYDVLLDDYEEGMTGTRLEAVFQPLQQELKDLLAGISKNSRLVFDRPFCLDKQQSLNLDLLQALGFSLSEGRLDRSAHPFTTSFHPKDVRLTTRYQEKDLFEALSSTVHEAGHGLYEQGLPLEWAGLPIGQAVSLGIHESQSRLWENMVMKSYPFWQGFYPKVQSIFSDNLSKVSLAAFYQHCLTVKPGLIRVESDEVTYNMHIFIRFDLERRLISGKLGVTDLPEAWAAAYEAMLGIRPKTYAEGFLQDVHWSCGLFGYFPTYALGNIYAAQLFDQIKKDLPDIYTDFEKGDFSALLTWLRQHVHSQASLYQADDLMTRCCGRGLDAGPFLAYLREKYID